MERRQFQLKLNEISEWAFIKIADNGSGSTTIDRDTVIDEQKIKDGDYLDKRAVILKFKNITTCQTCDLNKSQLVTYRKTFVNGKKWHARCNTCHKNIEFKK